MRKKLTNKEEKFSREYVKTGSPKEAYLSSYNTSNYKSNTIYRKANEVLQRDHVKLRIKELQKVTEKIAKEKFQIDSEEILRQLNIYRNANISDYVELVKDKEVLKLQFKPFSELTEEQLSAIESIKETRYGIELKLHGKDWTIEKINKHIGFYEKDNKQKNENIVIFEIPDNGRS